MWDALCLARWMADCAPRPLVPEFMSFGPIVNKIVSHTTGDKDGLSRQVRYFLVGIEIELRHDDVYDMRVKQ